MMRGLTKARTRANSHHVATLSIVKTTDTRGLEKSGRTYHQSYKCGDEGFVARASCPRSCITPPRRKSGRPSGQPYAH